MKISRSVVVSAVLSVLGVAFLFASGEPEAPRKSSPKVTLTFRHIWIAEHDDVIRHIFIDTLKRLQAENPWINIEISSMDQEIHRQQRLKVEMVTGKPPDVFVLWGGSEIDPYVRAGRMMDLTDFLEASGLRGRFVDLSMWERDGRVYGLPLEGFCEAIYYNKELFRKAGVKVPKTTDELLNVCASLKEAGITPFALGNRDKWPAVMVYQYCLNRSAGIGALRSLLAGSGSWTSPAYQRGTELFADLVALGAFTPSANSLPYVSQGTAFLQEEAAMVMAGSWDAERFGMSTISDKIGCFPFPAMNGGWGDQYDLCAGFSFGLGFSAAVSAEKKAAIEAFIAAVYSDAVQSRYVYEAARVPAMKIPIDPTRIANPVFAATLDLLGGASRTWPAYDGLLPPDINQAVNDGVQRLIAGGDRRKILEDIQRAQERLRADR